jgi:hypothetical protein
MGRISNKMAKAAVQSAERERATGAKKKPVTTVTITLEAEGSDEQVYAAVEAMLDEGVFQDAIKDFGDDNYGEGSIVVRSAVAT